MTRYYVETTVLVDSLLKTGVEQQVARQALSRASVRLLPAYAIKELYGGVLQYLVWLHNKCVDLGSFAAVQDSVGAVLRRQPYRAAAATKALADFMRAEGSMSTAALANEYPLETTDVALCDVLRLSLATKILLAWNKRAQGMTEVDGLSCFFFFFWPRLQRLRMGCSG